MLVVCGCGGLLLCVNAWCWLFDCWLLFGCSCYGRVRSLLFVVRCLRFVVVVMVRRIILDLLFVVGFQVLGLLFVIRVVFGARCRCWFDVCFVRVVSLLVGVVS